jgi:hypothetical protein
MPANVVHTRKLLLQQQTLCSIQLLQHLIRILLKPLFRAPLKVRSSLRLVFIIEMKLIEDRAYC